MTLHASDRRTPDEFREPSEYWVSAIVSTYNGERFIAECLADLEAQSIAERIEIVVVDSGSLQREGRIVREFQDHHANIRYLRTEARETVYAAWNRAILASSGRYITSANTDDRHRPDALEVMARILDALPEVALVYADCAITTIENQRFERCTPSGYYRWRNWNRDDLLAGHCFMGPQPMWRRALHAEYGLFDAACVTSGDYEFWLRISQTHPFLHLPVVLGLYLASPESVEHRNRALQQTENASILDLYRTAQRRGTIARRPFLPASGPAAPTAGRAAEEPGNPPPAKGNAPMAVNPQSDPDDPNRRRGAALEEVLLRAIVADRPAEQAARHLGRVVEHAPGRAAWHDALALLLYETGDLQAAGRHFEQAAAIDPQHPAYIRNLADYCLNVTRDLDRSLALYRQALQHSPGDATLLLLAGHLSAAKGEFADAADYYRQALDSDPASADAAAFLAQASARCAPPAEAPGNVYQDLHATLRRMPAEDLVFAIERFIQRYPDFALAYNDLAVLVHGRGDPEKAQALYEKALQLDPSSPLLKKNLADFYCLAGGRLEAGMQLYLEVLAADPADVEVLSAIGRISAALGKGEDARFFFGRVLQIDPARGEIRDALAALDPPPVSSAGEASDAQARYAAIGQRLGRGEPAAMIAALEDFIGRFPRFAPAHGDLGLLYGRCGQPGRAVPCLQRARELAPEDRDILRNLADALVAAGRMADALEAYRTLGRRLPEDAAVQLITGHLAAGLHRLEEARECYRGALQRDPQNGEVRQYLEAVERQLGVAPAGPVAITAVAAAPPAPEPGGIDAQEAYRALQARVADGRGADLAGELQRLLGRFPDCAPALNDLGVLHAAGGRYAEATGYYRRALALCPQSLVFKKNLAECLHMGGSPEEALALYVEIMAVTPKDPEVLFGLSRLCSDLGREADSRFFMEQFETLTLPMGTGRALPQAADGAMAGCLP